MSKNKPFYIVGERILGISYEKYPVIKIKYSLSCSIDIESEIVDTFDTKLKALEWIKQFEQNQKTGE